MEPVSLAMARTHVKASDTGEDELLEQLITAARVHVERMTGQLLVARQTHMIFDGFSSPLSLTAWPIAAAPALAVEYRAPATGDWTAVTPAPRLLPDRYPALVLPAIGAKWPGAIGEPQSVRVTLIAGYADGECPKPLVQAMLLLIGHWFENREASVSGTTSNAVAFGVDLLTEDFRRFA